VAAGGGIVGVVVAHCGIGPVDSGEQITSRYDDGELDQYWECGRSEEDRGRAHVFALLSGADRGGGPHGTAPITHQDSYSCFLQYSEAVISSIVGFPICHFDDTNFSASIGCCQSGVLVCQPILLLGSRWCDAVFTGSFLLRRGDGGDCEKRGRGVGWTFALRMLSALHERRSFL